LLFLFMVAEPVLVGLAMVGAFCTPQPECRRDNEAAMIPATAIAILLAIVFAIAVGALVKWGMLKSRDPAAAGRMPLLAAAVAAVLALLALRLRLGGVL